MEQDRSPKMELSKNLRLMKFMQRGKPVTEPELELKKKDTHWFADDRAIAKDQRIFKERSYVRCEKLLPIGRMSFKNFNPAVEVSSRKLYHQLLDENNIDRKEKEEGEQDVSDEEMANRYDTLVGTIGKKFSKKKKRKREETDTPKKADNAVKKIKFMKPKLD